MPRNLTSLKMPHEVDKNHRFRCRRYRLFLPNLIGDAPDSEVEFVAHLIGPLWCFPQRQPGGNWLANLHSPILPNSIRGIFIESSTMLGNAEGGGSLLLDALSLRCSSRTSSNLARNKA